MTTTRNEPVIAVHGGAWAIPEALWKESINGVKEAALIGYKILKNGGSAMDAVEHAVIYLEDNPAFDAGKGSVLTLEGQVEMDAMMMEGLTMNVGAVAAIRNVPNPIKVARLVLENTPHNLLVGEGANKFASAHGMHEVPPDTLVTPEAKECLERMKKFKTTIKEQFDNQGANGTCTSNSRDANGTCVSNNQDANDTCTSNSQDPNGTCVSNNQDANDTCTSNSRDTNGTCVSNNEDANDTCTSNNQDTNDTCVSNNHNANGTSASNSQDATGTCVSNNQNANSMSNNHDTVGSVCLDTLGRLACGTSTGGITAKMPGRVGDSPIVGAGGMADCEVGAVSTTGHGEAIAKVLLAKRVLDNIENGNSTSEAITSSLTYMKRRVAGYGGAVAISSFGDVGAQFSTEKMAWAYVKNSVLYYGLHPKQCCSEQVVL